MTIYISIFLGFLLTSFSFLTLYKLRSKIGLAPLFILLGAVQYFQSNLAELFNVKILNDIVINPVSTILFGGLLFAILLIYIKEGVAKARAVIIGVVISHLIMSVMFKVANAYQFADSQLSDVIISNALNSSFIQLLMYTVVLIIELLMLVVIYQFLIQKFKKQPFLITLAIPLLSVLTFDALILNLMSLHKESSLISEIISKSLIAILYATLLYFYLKYFDEEKKRLKFITNQSIDIFSILKYNKIQDATYLEAEDAKQKLNFDIKSTLNNISDGFISLDPNWHYTYINRKAADLLGRTPKNLIGKHIWTEFPEGKNLSFYKAYYKAAETQETIYFEDYYEPLDKWFENRVYPSKQGLTIYFRDITEKKKADNSIQMLRSLIDTSDEFIGLASLEGKPFFLNSNGRTMVGLGAEEKLPDSINDFFPDYYKKQIEEEQIPTVLAHGKWSGEAQFINFKTNKLIPIQKSGFLI